MLFRGVSQRIHEELQGAILPKGSTIEVVPKFDGSWRFDGKFHFGYSDRNGARAQQIESGKWDNCFVSTSRSYEVAYRFAVIDIVDGEPQPSPGVIYWIDEELCAQHGVVLKEFVDPLYPDEMEVSVRDQMGGQIPPAVIFKVEYVRPDNPPPSLP